MVVETEKYLQTSSSGPSTYAARELPLWGIDLGKKSLYDSLEMMHMEEKCLQKEYSEEMRETVNLYFKFLYMFYLTCRKRSKKS